MMFVIATVEIALFYSYNINSGTMPRGLWVPCHPEVYFRFIAASGVIGGGSGLTIDNFSLRPDPVRVRVVWLDLLFYSFCYIY